jgi:hypothetical protein
MDTWNSIHVVTAPSTSASVYNYGYMGETNEVGSEDLHRPPE